MTRIDIIDNIRGFAFIPMCIFHMFFAYDMSNMFTTHLINNSFIHILGLIRNVYILLAGVSLAIAAKDKIKTHKYYSSRLKRSLVIFGHAMIITILTHALFPEYGVKFGVLHFLALSSILISPIASSKILIIIALIASLMLDYPTINPVLDTITGAKLHYYTADWFPLNKNLPIILSGLLIGNIIVKYKETYDMEEDANDTYDIEEKSYISHTLNWIGKNSLNLYTGHMTLFITLAYIFKKK